MQRPAREILSRSLHSTAFFPAFAHSQCQSGQGDESCRVLQVPPAAVELGLERDCSRPYLLPLFLEEGAGLQDVLRRLVLEATGTGG